MAYAIKLVVAWRRGACEALLFAASSLRAASPAIAAPFLHRGAWPAAACSLHCRSTARSLCFARAGPGVLVTLCLYMLLSPPPRELCSCPLRPGEALAKFQDRL